MNEVYDLLLQLKGLGGKVYVADGKLKIDIEKGLLTPDIVAEIKQHRDELISVISQSVGQNEFVEIPALSEEQITYGQKNGYPISDAQRRLWVLSQFDEGSIAYNIPGNIYLDAKVNIEYFKQALEAVVDRHEILRTLFRPDESGEVKQWVLDKEDAGFAIEYVDLREKENKTELIQQHLQQNATKLFDLENGPLFSSGLLQVDDEDYVYIYNMHHIISDGWSFTVFFSDLQLFYEAFADGVKPIIGELRIQYKDYSVWQLGELNNDVSNEHRNYWLDYLKGEIPRIVLPSSKPRPRIMTFNGQTLNDQYIGPGTINKLKKYSEEHNGSPFMVFFAAWSILMYRYTKLRDITAGTPLSGREHVDLKNQIGFYVNTLAIRLSVQPEESFNDYFERVKDSMLKSYSHQMYPFNKLVEELEIPRDASRSVIFDVMLVYNGSDSEENTESKQQDELGGISDVEYVTSKFDLEIGFRDGGDHFTVWGTFNPDVYEADMIEGLVKHYKQLLRSILATPEAPVGLIDFLSKREKEQLTAGFNDTQADYPQLSIAQVFEEQVRTSPDATALVFSNGVEERVELSYGELNELANQFADYLNKNYGIEREDLIAFKLNRSHKVIITVLGILKAGAAYVPIDAASPKDRVASIQEDCKFCIDEEVIEDFYGKQSEYSISNPEIHASANDLAYVIYTSGSTGKPKGVMIEQRSVVRLVKNNGVYNFSPEDNLMATCSIGFDATTFEFFGPILNGATLIFCPKEKLIDPELFENEILLNEANMMLCTTGWLNQLVEVNLGLFGHLSTILVGGERLSPLHMRQLRDAYADLRMINVYGPTENATFSATHEIEMVGDDIPIGRPNSNSSVYILNDHHALQPVGVVGELYLGGDGLARGYLNDPELTVAKFISHPDLPEERLYKSGDLGYWLEDGTIAFIGREDDQVKVRGYRIELGEIEHALSSYNEITQGVLTVLDQEGDKELVAYFTSPSELNQQDLKIYLEEKLPAYMVPAYFIQVDEFTLNRNGKVDRKVLPSPRELGLTSGQDYIAPENELQEAIVAIWENVLKREKIGIRDDFFTLGGHSLRLVKLNNEYQKKFGIKLRSEDLFKHSSIVSHFKLLEAANRQEIASIPALKASELEDGKQNGFIISDAQRRLWILSQFKDGSAAYNIPGHVLLDEDIDIESFRRAVDATIERHEVLRTVFRNNEQNEVRQWILPPEEYSFTINHLDFRGKDREAVDAYILNDSFEVFDLENGPLLRASLLQVEEKKHVFYYNMHHIISDGWSMEVLTKDILANYEWIKKNGFDHQVTPAPLPKLRIQYKDFASWFSRELSENTHLEGQKQFWMDQLSGELPVLDLPSNQQRPALKTHNGRALTSFIDGVDTRMIKSFVSERGGTLFTGLLAVWNVLMYRYTGQKDILTGSPVAGRDHVDLENQIGFYVNTMVLRNQIDPKEQFTSFYSRLKENAIKSFEHQSYPFDRLVEELDVRRDTSRNAIFDIMFILQNNGEPRELGALSQSQLNEIHDLGVEPAKFDLSISFEEVGDYLSLNVIFNSDVYEPAMIEGLIKHYKRLLHSVLSLPEAPIASIDFMSEDAKELLTTGFNSTQADYPQLGIMHVFEDQVKASPHAEALVFSNGKEGSVRFTYQELNEQINQFADYLKKNYTIEHEDLIAFELDRSHKVIIAIYGILKAGAAYVPIDPSSSKERADSMKKDCTFCIDEGVFEDFYKTQSDYSTVNPIMNASGNDLAYVIYTSGSTGQPKGVMIEQQGIVRLVKNNGFYDLGPTDNLLATFSIGFDAATFEFFGPILNGGTLIFCPKEKLLDPELMENEIIQNKANIMLSTPSWLNQLIEVNIDLFSHLSTIFIGGERLSSVDVDRLHHSCPNLRVFNVYGPTENTSFSTTYEVHTVDDDIPIGRPISNSSVYVLNDQYNLQPIGVIGELYLGGDGLARGYLNSPELTAEKFISHDNLPEKRLYKSGDFGYWLDDGTLAFVGREDDQVKIRGYRIELGEIEYALSSYDHISNGIVSLLDHGTDKELVAYFTSPSEINIQELKAYLEEKLPTYMVPSYFVQVDEFTLNRNGKVDRKALPSPSELGLTSGQEYLEPENELQEAIVKIWENTLKREKIGMQDDFFDLGGHSLRAMRVISSYQKAFGVKLSINDLFRVTTPKGHEYLIQNETSSELQIPTVSIQKDYAISDAQRRIWVLSQFEEGSIAYNMPGYLPLNEEIEIELFKKAIRATVERHEMLRTVFQGNEHGEVRQIVKSIEELNLEIAELDFRDEIDSRRKVDALIERSSRQLFDLENGPLLSMKIARSGENEYVFIYNIHHIIGDGWSLEVMERDIMTFYTAFAKNESSNLDSLEIQYKDYAAWQLDQLNSETYAQHKEFWSNELNGELPVLNLSGAHQRPALKTNNGQIIQAFLSQDLSNRIKEFTSKEGGTVFMNLLSIWNILLYKYTGQKDQIIGTPVAGRDHADLSNQIGCYVNTLALRNQITEGESYASFYRRVREKTIESFSHQMYPFDRLVEQLQVEKDTSRNPIFDVMLTIVNAENSDESELPSPEKESAIHHLGSELAKFDLDLTFQEIGGRLSCYAIFNSDIYESALIEQLLQHFEVLANELLANPTGSIDQVNYLLKDEVKQLKSFSLTETRASDNRTFVDYFEEQAIKTPSSSALEFGDMIWSYQELNEKANHVASYLKQTYQTQPNDLVGIQLDRSPWIVALMIGILKSGGAYVPIDVNYPEERIRYMLEDSNAVLVFDDKELEALKTFSSGNVDSTAIHKDLSNLAYVMYTSGTTGKPKGVMISQHSLVDYALTFSNKFALSKEDRMIQQASIAFDTHVEEIFPILLAGGTILMGENGGSDIHELEALVKQRGATILSATPLILKSLNDQKSDLSNLRLLISGGDKFNSSYVSNFIDGCEVYDSYGPTEATVCATYAEYTTEKAGAIIGKPITNREIYILGDHQQLLPIGSIGEIYIGGEGLAIGYMNQPELTQEKFIDHPFKTEGKLYKSGDLGRWLANGEVEFIGRKDDQVKIRGYRVELSEVETALMKINSIENAVVLVRENAMNQQELVAFCVSNSAFDADALRNVLRLELPEYMIPAHLIHIEALPVTPNGKVDRKALSAYAQDLSQSKREHTPARNELERRWVEIWQKELDTERLGIDDDFFENGGNSIMAVRVSRVDDLHIPLKLIYQERTIRKCLEALSRVGDNDLIEIVPTNNQSEYNILLLPYAGATDVVYHQLSQRLAEHFNVFVVSMPWHSLSDHSNYQDHKWVEAQLMDEIQAKVKGKTFILGHCAGTILALSLSQQLEKMNFPLAGVFQCAENYQNRYNIDLENGGWSRFSDEEIWNDVIVKLGFEQEGLHEKTRSQIIKNLRHDARIAEHITSEMQSQKNVAKLNAPIHAIYGEKDPLTPSFNKEYEKWGLVSNQVSYSSIQNGGHYFVNQNIEETTTEILKQTERWKERELHAKTS
ncbi:MAG: amino acid adenylation domain-containing protein [Crocinitomicaceae bacterium]